MADRLEADALLALVIAFTGSLWRVGRVGSAAAERRPSGGRVAAGWRPGGGFNGGLVHLTAVFAVK